MKKRKKLAAKTDCEFCRRHNLGCHKLSREQYTEDRDPCIEFLEEKIPELLKEEK